MKKALLIGINDYSQAPLQGCLNDVSLMKNLLSGLNFKVQTLLDSEATKADILKALEDLIYKTNHGDSLVFHFSGHGSQVLDKQNTKQLKECILPYDFTWDNVLTDDEINIILKKTKAHVEIILDACHSGAGTTTVLFASKSEEHVQKFIQPPKELFKHIQNVFMVTVNKMEFENVTGWGGCKDDQTSADAYIDGQYNGAFTYAFVHCQLGTRRLTLHKIRAFMKDKGYVQEPQMWCADFQLSDAPFEAHKNLWDKVKTFI